MSKLVVHELDTSNSNLVFQEIVPTKDVRLEAIRPHLYIHNAPSGDVKVQVLSSDGQLVGESASQNISGLKTAAFAHGYYKFDVSTPLKEGVTYRIAVKADNGYSFAESAYIGVCKDWDNEKTEQTYNFNDQLNAPLDFELWGRDKMRVLDFSDGFESSSEPSQGVVAASGLQVFASDAAFTTFLGRSAQVGDAYLNSTLNRIRVYDSGSSKFRTSEFIEVPETEVSILNNQTNTSLDSANLTLSRADYHKVLINYSARRTDDQPTDVSQSGSIILIDNGTDFDVHHEFENEDAGITFAYVGGEVVYSSSDLIGGSYTGELTYEVNTLKQ